jgi:hypothetical protein
MNDHSVATSMAVSKVLSSNNYSPDVVGTAVAVNTVCQASDSSGGWCSCFQRCSQVDKTSLVVVGEGAGENHSLLRPNRLNEQQNFG